MKKALITGIAGQDGSYLAEYLLDLGYEVHGILRMPVYVDQHSLYLDKKNCNYHYADLRDEVALEKVIRRVFPDEIYNLAGQVFVPTSWSLPAETFDVNTGGLARILKIVERVCTTATRVYQASTSEMYGNAMNGRKYDDGKTRYEVSLNEASPMNPVSPYGVSKYAAHKLVDVYRQKGLFVSSGILFNHESPRRGAEMVTRKITKQVAQWVNGDRTQLRIGNMEAKRDWGYAGDYVKAMHAMLQQEKPEDFVVGTGEAHSVGDFLLEAWNAGGLQGIPPVVGNAPEFARPTELHYLIADYGKAKVQLGWEPKISFKQLVRLMVNSDIERLKRNLVGEKAVAV